MLYDTLLKLAHIIRVWLHLPQQALFFYEQALNLSEQFNFPQSHKAQALFFLGLAYRGS